MVQACKPPPPHSIQKQPEHQICPKFVPAIIFGGSSQGVWNFSENLSKNYLTNLDKFQSPDWNPSKQSLGQILDKFGVRDVLEARKGKKGSQVQTSEGKRT